MTEEQTIHVCPWIVSVSRPFSDGIVDGTFVKVSVGNQLRGQMMNIVSAVGEEATHAASIMRYVATLERNAKAYCFAAWDEKTDALQAAMVEQGASFAPGYASEVPVVIQGPVIWGDKRIDERLAKLLTMGEDAVRETSGISIFKGDGRKPDA